MPRRRPLEPPVVHAEPGTGKSNLLEKILGSPTAPAAPSSDADELYCLAEDAELTAKFLQLTEKAAALNAASDALGQPIVILDGVLKSLNIGVETWVVFDSGTDQLSQREWQRALGYSKLHGKWGITIRDAFGPALVPEWEAIEEYFFAEAPRALRVAAIGSLPKLLDALIHAADETTVALKSKVAAASDVARVAQAVLKARKGGQ
jgi:hypothetical protein